MKESLAEQLKQKFVKKKRIFPTIKPEQVDKGSIVYVSLDPTDGITVNGGYKSRAKFITIIGELPDDYIVGSLLINTRANFANEYLESCQYPLKQSDYPDLLDYQSWLDCSKLWRIPKSKILTGGYCGKILEKDMKYIMQCLVDTPTISKKEKLLFGIIEK